MVCLEKIWCLPPKGHNHKFFIEVFACLKRSCLGNGLFNRQAGQILAKSLLASWRSEIPLA